VRRIGLLLAFSQTDLEAQGRMTALRLGLQALGWTERRNLRIDERWADSDTALLTPLLPEQRRLGVLRNRRPRDVAAGRVGFVGTV
jgi:hypothetical protein